MPASRLHRNVHSHDDDRLTVGCPECIRATRAAEEVARWEQAPLRTVTWQCTYDGGTPTVIGETSILSFSLTVRVPDDATPDEVDEHYAGQAGEAFALALPDSVPMDATTWACETMEVESVKIGPPIVAEVPAVSEPSLFGPWGAVE
jgi:hypothetical protein